MIKEINGDIIELLVKKEIDVLVHGCNCLGIMGRGIAKQIKEIFPEAYKIIKKGNYPGTVNAILINDVFIVNAFTQINIGKASKKYSSFSPINNFILELEDTQVNRYIFIRECLKKVKYHFQHLRIGLPMIGAGLAGGDWVVIKKIIEEELKDCNILIVYYKSPLGNV